VHAPHGAAHRQALDHCQAAYALLPQPIHPRRAWPSSQQQQQQLARPPSFARQAVQNGPAVSRAHAQFGVPFGTPPPMPVAFAARDPRGNPTSMRPAQ
jgi:hypothetical protein